MFSSILAALVLGATVSSAAPLKFRDVTLDAAAVAEAQVRDNTATRAFSNAPIKVRFFNAILTHIALISGYLFKTSDGQCLFVDPASGDFRENLTPVTTAACDGSAGQQWDVITKGVHNDQAGFALVVSSQVRHYFQYDLYLIN